MIKSSLIRYLLHIIYYAVRTHRCESNLFHIIQSITDDGVSYASTRHSDSLIWHESFKEYWICEDALQVFFGSTEHIFATEDLFS